MTLYGRSSRWAAALVLGLAGVIGAGAATGLAAPSDFALTLEARDTMLWEDDEVIREHTRQGTFKSRAPFCPTGTFVDLGFPARGFPATWRFTCDDGTGGLTVSVTRGHPSEPTLNTSWHILDGTGSYASLRGRGSMRGALLGRDNHYLRSVMNWRSTFQGVADRDAVAPSIAIDSARATKLRRPAGAYALRLGVTLRDDVTDNRVSYTLRASAGGVELARRFGTAAGAVSMTLRIRPRAGARTVQLQLTGVDPVGNAVSVNRALSLPR